MGGACSTWVGERRSAYTILQEKPEGQTAFEKPRRGWEKNIKMALQDLEWGTDGIDPAEDMSRWSAVRNAVMSLRGQ